MVETSHFGWSLTAKHENMLKTILQKLKIEYTIEIIISYLLETQQENNVYKGYYHKNISSFQNNGNGACSVWLNKLEDNKVNICLLGLGAQGKTTLVHRFITNQLLQEYDPTIEDSYRASITLNTDDSDKDKFENEINKNDTETNDMNVEYQQCLVEILDTAGQQQFMSLMDHWIKTNDFFMLLFDTNDAFKSCVEIIDKIKRIKDRDKDDFGMMFVATKRDLVNSGYNLMDNKHAIKYCIENNIAYFETSSVGNKHVHLLFRVAVYEHWIQTIFKQHSK